MQDQILTTISPIKRMLKLEFCTFIYNPTRCHHKNSQHQMEEKTQNNDALPALQHNKNTQDFRQLLEPFLFFVQIQARRRK